MEWTSSCSSAQRLSRRTTLNPKTSRGAHVYSRRLGPPEMRDLLRCLEQVFEAAERLGDLLHRELDARLDRPERNAGVRRDFALAHPLVESVLDDFALRRWQRLE